MIDPQDPLPEGQWLFRRIFTWSVTLALLALLAAVVWRTPGELLPPIGIWLIGLIALVFVLYLLAPSAPEMARLLAELKFKLPFGRSGDPK